MCGFLLPGLAEVICVGEGIPCTPPPMAQTQTHCSRKINDKTIPNAETHAQSQSQSNLLKLDMFTVFCATLE
jgi:hypothetical protein